MKTLGKRVKALNFLPGTSPVYDDEPEFWLEKILLQMLFDLQNDKQRIILLILILRENGYNLDHKSVSRALNIDTRWYMRVKKMVADNLRKHTTA